ncbi:MAG TPA: type II toxin-antitoxin system VapC family toxin [Candidatus Acidoferrales bacterium]|nr:type II toxin-antitoxin system VapC family toxin [Candidatus Acidoferrales bacterium]
MTSLVLDASVAAKWLLPPAREPLAAEAAALLDRYRAGSVRFLVPDLFWAELANVLWKSVRQGRISAAIARRAIQSFVESPFPSFPSLPLMEAAFGLATNFGCSPYDGLCLALAMTSGTQFLTADEKLAHALAAYLPVKWLGAFSN